jgi:hypothetical protein
VDVEERAEVIVQLERFLCHAQHQCGEGRISYAGLRFYVQDIEEHTPIALQAIFEAGIGRMVKGAEQGSWPARPTGLQAVAVVPARPW